jgi:hypothetical protein
VTRANGHLTFRLRNLAVRWALCLLVCAGAAWMIFISSRWAIAETALYVTPTPQVLAGARNFQPGNPEISYRLGTYHLDLAQPPDMEIAARLLNESIAVAPNRYATWLALGRARERAGDAAGAENAFQRALALAPNYAQTRWQAGNFFLRNDRLQEAIEQMRLASEARPSLVPSAIRIVWRATGEDLAATTRVTGESRAAQAALVDFLIEQKRFDDATALWRKLADTGGADPTIDARGRVLANALLESGDAGKAVSVWASLTPDRPPVVDEIQNAGFEKALAERTDSPFDWTVTQAQGAIVRGDVGRSGGRSLRVDYNAGGGPSFTHAVQMLQVRPGASYELRFWARTENLKTGGPPALSIVDGSGNSAGATSPAFPIDTSNWAQFAVDFTGPASGVVIVRFGRVSCGAVCPIFGTVWLDDLELEARR